MKRKLVEETPQQAAQNEEETYQLLIDQVITQVSSLQHSNQLLETFVENTEKLKIHDEMNDDENVQFNLDPLDQLADQLISESQSIVSFNVSGQIFHCTKSL